MEITRLSKKEQWESRWSNTSKNNLTFDPEQPLFRETHRILHKYLPQKNSAKFLEVGAYPGKFLWYFYTYHGYEPWGVEYVESCAQQAQEMLTNAKVPAHIIAGDFFNLRADKYIEGNGWNLVVSFGFVEHFDEPEIAVSKHFEVACPGGLVVVSVPNHAGWNGKIMRYVDKDKWKQHNCMSLDDLIAAFKKTGNNEILFSGHAGHIGFWNTCLYENAKKRMGKFYPLLRAPLWIIEKLGQWVVPNNKYSSPEIIVIAKKYDVSEV